MPYRIEMMGEDGEPLPSRLFMAEAGSPVVLVRITDDPAMQDHAPAEWETEEAAQAALDAFLAEHLTLAHTPEPMHSVRITDGPARSGAQARPPHPFETRLVVVEEG